MSNELALAAEQRDFESREAAYRQRYKERRDGYVASLTNEYSYFAEQYQDFSEMRIFSSDTFIEAVHRLCTRPYSNRSVEDVRDAFERLIDDMAQSYMDLEVDSEDWE